MLEFWLCFVPLFVAVDAVGVMPIFLSLTQGMDRDKVRQAIYRSLATAAGVALAFLALGTAILHLLGITVADFMVAGGILLFLLAIGDLLANEKLLRQVDVNNMGIVPLGVPLITGPAVLTTSMLLLNQYGAAWTATAIVANILIAGAVFFFAGTIGRVLGQVGEKIISKIAMLLLAAIGVMMVRKGIESFITAGIASSS
ncbi:MAG: MarC family protein [Methylotenera sp.]|nr:MarC family protein [Methylotenera sp.]MDO9232967.1 MarC family protein [Methylotenera sp.]MDP1595320.1 MarC family protein [Methylotenera sp.]MDP1755208.1 MarC family protein [Methylotenera sp.]MDP1959480.1 MarC family protein [Methylotenera sp.]